MAVADSPMQMALRACSADRLDADSPAESMCLILRLSSDAAKTGPVVCHVPPAWSCPNRGTTRWIHCKSTPSTSTHYEQTEQTVAQSWTNSETSCSEDQTQSRISPRGRRRNRQHQTGVYCIVDTQLSAKNTASEACGLPPAWLTTSHIGDHKIAPTELIYRQAATRHASLLTMGFGLSRNCM